MIFQGIKMLCGLREDGFIKGRVIAMVHSCCEVHCSSSSVFHVPHAAVPPGSDMCLILRRAIGGGRVLKIISGGQLVLALR